MYFLLAEVAHEAAAEGGNPVFQLFENNLINWIVLIVVIVYFCAKSLPAVFAQRRSTIEAALQEAHQTKVEGEAFLVEQQQRIANAERESDTILVEAKQIADKMRADMEVSTKKELADLEQRMSQEVVNQRQMAIMQMRTTAAKAAIALSEAHLPAAMNDKVRGKLVNDFIEQIEATSK
jgi:F0F1-type ATP synthase membrane subunit b/b'